jgi:hypothetical protein
VIQPVAASRVTSRIENVGVATEPSTQRDVSSSPFWNVETRPNVSPSRPTEAGNPLSAQYVRDGNPTTVRVKSFPALPRPSS